MDCRIFTVSEWLEWTFEDSSAKGSRNCRREVNCRSVPFPWNSYEVADVDREHFGKLLYPRFGKSRIERST